VPRIVGIFHRLTFPAPDKDFLLSFAEAAATQKVSGRQREVLKVQREVLKVMTLSEGNGRMIMLHAGDLLPGLNIGEVNFGDVMYNSASHAIGGNRGPHKSSG
jgi:hypothetical protein